MTEKPLPLTTYLGEYSRPEYALSMWLKAFLHDAPTKDARPIELLPNFCMDGARQILDNLPRLHEQSLDTLIRLATEKAHAAGMRIELIAHGPEETPEPTDRLTAIEAELAKMRELWRLVASAGHTEWRGRILATYGVPQSTPGHEAAPAPAQTRTYPELKWLEYMKKYSDCVVDEDTIGTVWRTGEWRLRNADFSYTRGCEKDYESAKAALESKFRQQWDELHPQQS